MSNPKQEVSAETSKLPSYSSVSPKQDPDSHIEDHQTESSSLSPSRLSSSAVPSERTPLLTPQTPTEEDSGLGYVGNGTQPSETPVQVEEYDESETKSTKFLIMLTIGMLGYVCHLSHCLPLLSTPSHVLTMTRQIANHVDCRTRSRHCKCILSVISTIRGLINAALSLVARHEQSNDCYCMGCRTAFWDHRTTLCWGYERQLSNKMGQTKAVHDWRSSFIHRLRHAVRLGREDRHMFPDGREC
jgi:hypothetical protein